MFSRIAITEVGNITVSAFTRIVLGIGYFGRFKHISNFYDNDGRENHRAVRFFRKVRALKQMIKPVLESPIKDIKPHPLYQEVVEIEALISNHGLKSGVFVREIGIFAKGHYAGEDVLYGYANAGKEGEIFIPAESSERNFQWLLKLVVPVKGGYHAQLDALVATL